MPSTALEFRELNEMIGTLPEDDFEKVYSFVSYLKYIRLAEDEEDRRMVLERRSEEDVPFSEAMKELGLD